jgi:quinolinate synthase
VKDVVPAVEWPLLAPYVHAINQLKAERNAVVLAHNYMTPDVFGCVGDIRGDSLQLAREATRTPADLIVQAGVYFMAETAKILNPGKTVLIPDLRAGCSLAASITGRDVRLMREAHPGVPVVTYVNSSAEVKAESDICCTSSNAVQVTEWAAAEWGTDKVIVIPDEYLARNVATQTSLRIITWQGRCEVHERFTAADVASLKQSFPGALILAHPECRPTCWRPPITRVRPPHSPIGLKPTHRPRWCCSRSVRCRTTSRSRVRIPSSCAPAICVRT